MAPLKPPKFIAQLDGLRGIAILLVLWAHSWEAFQVSDRKFGWIGVDLFFVLSGFLITGLLLETKGAPHYFRNFYARRGLRIWPLYYLVIAFIFVANSFLPARLQFPTSICRIEYYLSYVQNLFVPGFSAPGVLLVTWSLAVEEQFYLIWPFLVGLFSRKNLRHVLIAVVLLDPLFRWYLIRQGGDAHVNTAARLDQLAMGALIAVWIRSESFSLPTFRRIAGGACLFLLPAILYLKWHGAIPYEIAFTVLGLVFSGLLGLSLTSSPGSILVRILKLRFLRYTGKISYGIYLLHATCFAGYRLSPLNRVVRQWPLRYARPVTVAVEIGLAYLAATISWYLLESRVLKLKSRFETQPAATSAEGSTEPVQVRVQSVGSPSQAGRSVARL